MVTTNQITVGSATALTMAILAGSRLKKSTLLLAMSPKQLATTALVLGTVDAVAASGLAVGLIVKGIGCDDIGELGATVRRWRRRTVGAGGAGGASGAHSADSAGEE